MVRSMWLITTRSMSPPAATMKSAASCGLQQPHLFDAQLDVVEAGVPCRIGLAVVERPDVLQSDFGSQLVACPRFGLARGPEHLLVHERGAEPVRLERPQHGLHLDG